MRIQAIQEFIAKILELLDLHEATYLLVSLIVSELVESIQAPKIAGSRIQKGPLEVGYCAQNFAYGIVDILYYDCILYPPSQF